MPRAISRRKLLKKFRSLGFEGPYSGGRHQFMKKGELKVRIPNLHGNDIDGSLSQRFCGKQRSMRSTGIKLNFPLGYVIDLGDPTMNSVGGESLNNILPFDS